ncbi:GNAT family N-acetyltransferase [Vibrio alfacsensis]|uniref:GNAT family N-acetyltransferase n=1 Tax=Vibrio alfacsensis TaxID=1074311 RepID=UPI0040693B13
MKVTPAEKMDLNPVYELEKSLFGHHAYPEFFFRQAFDCWGSGFLVAKEEARVVGYVLMAASSENNTQWILSLAVDSSYRGKGIARSLVEHVLAIATTGTLVKLTVDPNNAPAYQLYCSLGFIAVEEEENYFGDDDARLVMQLTA